MRIVFISTNACEADAVGKHLALTFASLRNAGHELALFVSDASRLHPELRKFTQCFASIKELGKDEAARELLNRADRVCFEFAAASPLFELLPILARKKTRTQVTYHGITPVKLVEDSLRSEVEAALAQLPLLAFADQIQCGSDYARRELSRTIQIPVERIQVMPMAWVTPIITSPPQPREQVLLYVGRIARHKKLGTAIEALALLPDELHDVTLVCIGNASDIYRAEKTRCEKLATKLGIGDRVKFLGRVSEAELAQWYQKAVALVLPSAHECFGIPVLEAFANKLPVIVSDAACLPETVGHAAVIVPQDQPPALAKAIEKLLQPQENWLELGACPKLRVALVSPRYGADVLGGAETSLRTIAKSLHQAGHRVEVLTTCNRDMSRWANHYPAGETQLDGIPLHRFPIDPFNTKQLDEAYQEIVETDGNVSSEVQQQYLNNSLNSTELIQYLRSKYQEYDAILVGPYLFHLTHEVVHQFAEKAVLVPCFHEEPLAHISALQECYRKARAILFHSRAEANLTALKFQIRNPRHGIIGTLLPPEATQRPANTSNEFTQPYVVYCGRYCEEKGLPELLRFMEAYQRAHPNSMKLVCIGSGPMKLPSVVWLKDVGFISEERKRQLLSGAVALVHLSRQESLSIVALEAWALKVPVIASSHCPVLVDHLEQSGGGYTIDSSEEFNLCLRQLLENPTLACELGNKGFHFTQQNYLSPDIYRSRIEEVLQSLTLSDADAYVQAGLKRAEELSWPRTFPRYLKQLDQLTKRPSSKPKLTLSTSQRQGIVTISVTNSGPLPLLHQGKTGIRIVLGQQSSENISTLKTLRLPRLLLPGESLSLRCKWKATPSHIGWHQGKMPSNIRWQNLNESSRIAAPSRQTLPSSDNLLARLLDLEKNAQLPRDYLDVTEGVTAPLKKWAKQKLLNNFRKAYVDVAFRRQSRFNQQLLELLGQLLVSQEQIADLTKQVSQLRKRIKKQRQPSDTIDTPLRENLALWEKQG